MLFQRTFCQRQMPSLKRQQGIVIVVALFIVALVATMAAVMMARFDRDTERTQLIMNDRLAEFYAAGSVLWAKDRLRNDWELKKSDQLVDAIPILSPVKEVNGYKIKSTIYDMQSRFNLNNLTTPDSQAQFKHLLQVLLPKLSDTQIQKIVNAVSDWISPVNASNEFSRYYAELPVPYRTAHRLMTVISELRLIKGVTPEVYNALQPYVTALPIVTKVNVQTASVPVLTSLGSTMTVDAAKMIVEARQQKPFVKDQDFSSLPVVKNHPIKATDVTTVSAYFWVQTEVTIENQHILLYTLMERAASANKTVVNIVWQSKGMW